jgi:hypothetical protein
MIHLSLLAVATLLPPSDVAAAPVVSATSHSAAGQRHHGWLAGSANPRHPWLYVAGFFNNSVNIYDLHLTGSPLIGSITNGIDQPAGIAVDAQGSLYVANSGNTVVTEYFAGATVPSLTLSVPGPPQDIALDAGGNVYVCVRGNSPGIAVYAPDQTSPTRYITSDLIQIPNQIAFDSAGTLYIADDNTGVSVLPPGPSQQVTSLDLKGLVFPGACCGMALNPQNGVLYLSFAQNPPTRVLEFAPGQENPKFSRSLAFGGTNFMTTGTLHGHVRVFVPDSSGDTVYVFKETLHGTPGVITTASQGVNGVAFKAAGVP